MYFFFFNSFCVEIFRHLIGEVSRDPRVPSLRQLSLPALVNLKDLLDRCQKSLDEFLEVKFDSKKYRTSISPQKHKI